MGGRDGGKGKEVGGREREVREVGGGGNEREGEEGRGRERMEGRETERENKEE